MSKLPPGLTADEYRAELSTREKLRLCYVNHAGFVRWDAKEQQIYYRLDMDLASEATEEDWMNVIYAHPSIFKGYRLLRLPD
jgi:hypothetical protein